MTTAHPGWYDDGHGVMRWWDGERWTEHVAEPEVTAPRGIDNGFGPVGGEAGYAPRVAPAKSKLWVAWTALGIVVLGVVIGGAVFVAQWSEASAQSEKSGTADDSDKLAAVAGVEQYDSAWQNADRDSYLEATTDDFRTQMGLTDCSAFETRAEEYRAGVEDYDVAVVDVVKEGGVIRVTTTETYTSLVGDDGTSLDEPVPDSIEWEYILIPDGREWVVDDALDSEADTVTEPSPSPPAVGKMRWPWSPIRRGVPARGLRPLLRTHNLGVQGTSRADGVRHVHRVRARAG